MMATSESLATSYANEIGSGHLLVVVMKNAYPINILPRLKDVPEVASIYCATANPLEVLIMETEQGRGIIGVVDGFRPKGIEKDNEVKERNQFLRNIGAQSRMNWPFFLVFVFVIMDFANLEDNKLFL